jgi:Right handed beta helix region
LRRRFSGAQILPKRTSSIFILSRRHVAKWAAAIVCAAIAGEVAAGQVYRVGPTREYQLPSQVIALVADGDTVEIDAGAYPGDVAIWRAHRLTLRGVGGRAHLIGATSLAEDKAIWVTKGNDTVIENIEFSAAVGPAGNGAGIRAEGEGLVVRRCYFHGNQNGILGGAGEVLVEHSEFARNGAGDGFTHNMYISERVQRFTLRYSYSHHAKVGHNVKSRARENYIQYNRLMDEADGNSSYVIDIPDGGIAYVIGNLLQQGPRTENLVMLSYGAESFRWDRNELYVVNNTFVNDAGYGGFVRVAEQTSRAVAVNNFFVGLGRSLSPRIEARNNLVQRYPQFLDAARYDYRLAAGSPAIDAGVDPGRIGRIPLVPTAEYRHSLGRAPRSRNGPLDIGAHEFGASPSVGSKKRP